MKIYEYPFKKAMAIQKSVIALGFFDGVHIAHRDLLLCAKETAEKEGLAFGIFTFPAESDLKFGAKRLYSTKERLVFFEKLGADFTVIADFSKIAPMSPEDFVTKTLVEDLKCDVAIVGFNYRFGKNASGDSLRLSELMKNAGKRAVIKEELRLGDTTVSASLIRHLLSDGDVKEAAKLLGIPYKISGKVEHGNGVGHALGFPTVNTSFGDDMIRLRSGVYKTAIPINDRIYVGITNVGVCPTFDEREVHAETYIIGFDGDLYGENLDIYFLDFLRDEKKFNSQKELIMQINIDKNRAISENGAITWQELGLK